MSYLDTIPQIPDGLSQYLNKPIGSVPALAVINKQLALFSNALQSVPKDSFSAQAKSLARTITTHQIKISRHLSYASGLFSEKLLQRITTLVNDCASFKDLIKNRAELKTSAELIFPHLQDRDFCKSVRRDCLSESARTYFTSNAKKSLRAARDFMQRVHEETYGVKLKAKLLDSSENLLFAQESFLRLLYLDLIMQDKDPSEHTEWFQSENNNDIYRCAKKEIQHLRGGATKDLDGKLLLRADKILTKGVNEKISQAAAKANLPNTSYNLVLEYLRLYFSPSPAELTRALSHLLPTNPNEALQLVKTMLSEQDLSQLEEIVKTLKAISPEQGKALIQSLKEENSPLYVPVLSKFLILSIALPNALKIAEFFAELAPLMGTKEYENVLEALVKERVTRDLRESDQLLIFAAIIERKSVPCLDCFIKKLVTTSECVAEVDAVRSLLERIKENTTLFQTGLALLAYRFMMAKSVPAICDLFLKLYGEINDKKMRRLLSDKVCLSVISQTKPGDAISFIENFVAKLSDKEKLHLLRVSCYTFAFVDQDSAKKLAGSIPDAFIKQQVLDLIETIKPLKRSNIQVHAIGLSQDDLSSFMSGVINRFTDSSR